MDKRVPPTEKLVLNTNEIGHTVRIEADELEVVNNGDATVTLHKKGLCIQVDAIVKDGAGREQQLDLMVELQGRAMLETLHEGLGFILRHMPPLEDVGK